MWFCPMAHIYIRISQANKYKSVVGYFQLKADSKSHAEI